MAAMLSSTGALAQQAAGKTDSWQFGVSIYGWFPDIAGQTAFTQPGGSSEFEIGIENILDNLEFTLMGTFDARKGRWGFLVDGIYMEVDNSKTGTREASIGGNPLPINATADVNLDLESWIWTAAGYFRAVDQPDSTLDLVAGGRYLDVEQKVNWNITDSSGTIPALDLTGTAKTSLSNWDAIIGVRGRIAFGAKKAWFVPYYLDVGAGDSDFTWQGIAGLGYALRWIDVVAAWRYLYYDMPSGKAIKDINFSGPAIGLTFRW
ncbi:MAG: hypothetical protein AMJ54_15595 [Deltaproteobacteria bacterium SG8_13]|nr:MAG: hypothetical protein AMJ54_15595 [Deltaproteobacteria bacterium SG8_13]